MNRPDPRSPRRLLMACAASLLLAAAVPVARAVDKPALDAGLDAVIAGGR